MELCHPDRLLPPLDRERPRPERSEPVYHEAAKAILSENVSGLAERASVVWRSDFVSGAR